jgi:hypothetical protein
MAFDFGSLLGGGLSGAATGSAFGPIGTVAGGILGGLSGAFGGGGPSEYQMTPLQEKLSGLWLLIKSKHLLNARKQLKSNSIL